MYIFILFILFLSIIWNINFHRRKSFFVIHYLLSRNLAMNVTVSRYKLATNTAPKHKFPFQHKFSLSRVIYLFGSVCGALSTCWCFMYSPSPGYFVFNYIKQMCCVSTFCSFLLVFPHRKFSLLEVDFQYRTIEEAKLKKN